VPALRERFPALARRELEELCARRAYALRRRNRETLHVLTWHRPGAVWALDFTDTPCLVDRLYPKLMLVRDLASRAELESLGVSGESARETVLGLEHSFEVYGAPFVLKADNGPGNISHEARELCERHGVLILYSPPKTPSYNGSREAAGGSLKNRTRRIAAAQGRSAAWTSDDVELARDQMNHCPRPWGQWGPSPAQAWQHRAPITPAEREAFHATYRRHEAEQRELDGIAPGALLTREQQAIIDRAALGRTLRTHGLLEVRRG
jgi:transposase InsO family protein